VEMVYFVFYLNALKIMCVVWTGHWTKKKQKKNNSNVVGGK
jgi:hypothetical protein